MPCKSFLGSFAAAIVTCFAIGSTAQASDDLAKGFQTPPDSAKPRVWWHWMNGNVTEEGIRQDLEWMAQTGIGGVQNFMGGFERPFAGYTPPDVANPVILFSPEWGRALRYSVELSDRLGLEFTVASSAGWSLTGGSWVKPAQAMKKLVWSETLVSGGEPFQGRLARPPETTGLFQDIPLPKRAGDSSTPPSHYADVATVAYRAPVSEIPISALKPIVTSSAGAVDAALLTDGNLAIATSLPFGISRQAWIQFTFPMPQRIQAISAVTGPPLSGIEPLMEIREQSWLEASEDGRTFRKVLDLPRFGAPQQTTSFAGIVAPVFRVVFARPSSGQQQEPTSVRIAELMLHTAARVNHFEDKAAFSSRKIAGADDTPEVSAEDVVHKSDVIDLTTKMRPDGSLAWTPPPGHWVVLRFGYSLIGRVNAPAPGVSTGLEVDKLNRTHVQAYIDTYLGEFETALGADLMGHRGLRYLLMDSYEAGAQNWTDDLLKQFNQSRGYDPTPWLPVLAGRVVQSPAASDRFLWDFRRTLSELIAEAHYGRISQSVRSRGMGLYSESHEARRSFIGDGMQVKKMADVPMAETWAVNLPWDFYTAEAYDSDIRESAAVAHIYGKNVVAAEAFTVCQLDQAYGFAPERLKPIADRAMAMGVNRFVVHTSTHQPDNRVGPGIGLGYCGQWFTRKETWAHQARSWIDYLARSSYLLQQGRFVADVAYLYGEDTNIAVEFRDRAVPIPEGYAFDFVNADVVLNQMSVRDGKLITPTGMSYRVLALDESTKRMSLPVLRKLKELVRQGATVAGPKPSFTPSLADDEHEFNTIVAQLWGSAPGRSKMAASGVVAYQTPTEALTAMKVAPDVRFAKAGGGRLRFLHRALEESDIYFVSSDLAHPQLVQARFRVSGKRPELWRPDTGDIAPLSYRIENGETLVQLALDANGAVFVVFREATDANSMAIPAPTTRTLAVLKGAWDVNFPADLGAPAHERFAVLSSWTDSTDRGIRYFSGTATYSKALNIRRDWLAAGARIHIDLGAVKNLAEILINGRSLDVLWKPPFRIDITDALRAGENRLEIKVTNLWPNRLIGDHQPGARRISHATFDPFTADSPLMPSGLLGPVSLIGLSR